MTYNKTPISTPQKPELESTAQTSKSFGERLRAVKQTRWIRFAVVSLIFFGWVVLMGNLWLLLVYPLLFDIYLTQYIPYNWWKKRPNPTRTIMAWVDAMVYALVLIYFLFAFVGQQYEIPSSSLEKSLLVGDRLWVDKTVYGARVPQTPIHFPLAQHTLPLLNCKSYVDKPQLEYHRIPGRRSVERGDIVVFNFPNGDTVALNTGPRDYYQVVYDLQRQGVEQPRQYIADHPELFGKVVWRPVDRRENYVKRVVGLPGERLRIAHDIIYINGKAIAEPENVQYNYIIPVKSRINPYDLRDLGLRMEDIANQPIDIAGNIVYDLPLTAAMKAELEKRPEIAGPLVREADAGLFDLGGVFPLGNDYGWTRPDMGEFWIPKRGSTLHLTLDNLPIYRRAIAVYEGNDLKVKDGKILINGELTEYYTFKMDYFWMMGDNRDRSLDSRYWGFVPEDHVVGSPVFIILSLDQDRGLTEGKVRTDRFFRSPNPDKSAKKW